MVITQSQVGFWKFHYEFYIRKRANHKDKIKETQFTIQLVGIAKTDIPDNVLSKHFTI